MIVRTAFVLVTPAVALTSSGPSTAAEGTYDIPTIISLTGLFAFSGKDVADAVTALEDYENKAGTQMGGAPLP